MDKEQRIQRIKTFLKDAPTIAGPWINKKVNSLNSRLQSLRYQYKEASEELKKELTATAMMVKNELEIYEVAQGQKEPTPPAQPKDQAEDFEQWMKKEEQQKIPTGRTDGVGSQKSHQTHT